MLKQILATLCLSTLIIGCSPGGSSNNNNAGNNPGADELGYTPSDRWPEKGDYSYDFTESINGVRCQAKKEFNNKSDFCMGLQDETLNNSCAQNSRERSYSADCGDDFQPINFPGSKYWRSGFDSRQQKRCETGRPPAVFRTYKHYCEFLKDERLHNNCFWDDRREDFKDSKCQGEFSPEPEVEVPPVVPTPTPNPTPGPNPTPAPTPNDPLDQIPVVRALRAGGIEVEIDWQAIRSMGRYPMPGELSETEQFKVFWKELSDNLQNILARKKSISKIRVSIYTNYMAGTTKWLLLNYRTNPGELATYFPLYDKILNYSAILGVEIDFIHSTSARGHKPYAPLARMISVIEANWKALSECYGLIKEIELESYSSYYSFSRTLNLDEDELEKAMPAMLALLRPLAPVYNWAEQSGVKIDADYDIVKEGATVVKAFALIQKSLTDLDALVKANKLDEINIYMIESTSIDSTYYESTKNLSLTINSKSAAAVTKSLQSLGKMVRYEAQLGVPIKMFSSDLDADFDKSMDLFEKVLGKVKAKLALINEISIGYTSDYYSKKLRIGSESTLAETEAIISKIK